MADQPYFPNLAQYSLEATDPNMSLEDQKKMFEQYYSPELKQNLDQTYGQQRNVMPQAQPTAPQETQPIGAEGTSVQGPTQPPGDIIQALLGGKNDIVDPKMQKALVEALDQTNPLKPKETIGNPKLGEFLTGVKGGNGGIMGTGIQPIDILAFALGAAITSRMPQDKAIATTMAIAKMPSQLRDTQAKAVQQYIGNVSKTIQEQLQEAALQEAHLGNLEKLTKLTQGFSLEQRRQAFFSMAQAGKVDLTSTEGRTAALAAGMKPEELNAIAKLKTDSKPANVGAEREAHAQMLGYEHYFDATPQEKAQIEQQVKAREDQRLAQDQQRLQLIERGQDISKGRLELQQAKTLSQAVNINGKVALADNTVLKADNPMQASAKAGYRYLPITQLQKLQATNLALTQINRLEQLTNKLFAGVSKGENLVNYFKLNGQRKLGDADSREFRTLLFESLPVNAQASGLTAGAAGKLGIIKIEKEIMPNDSDTAESVVRKYKQLRQRFHNGREIYFGNGIDPRLGEDHEQLPEGVTVTGGRKK